jgi:hypothetical protein
MFICPKYSYLQTNLLAEYDLPRTHEKYYEFFHDMSKEKIKSVHAYVKCMLDAGSP